MSTLSGRAPKDTFGDLLQISNANSGIDATLRTVENGKGTSGPWQISTVAFRILGTTTMDLASGAILDISAGTFKADAILESTSAAGVTIDSVLLKDNAVTATTLTANTSVKTDTVSEKTSAAGVTVDGVLLKDNGIVAPGAIKTDATTDSTSTTTGSMQTDGGLGIAKTIVVGTGIKLGGSVAANLLDDYEEGTWTPAILSTVGFTDSSIANIDARYTKIGRQVTLEFEFELDASSGNVTVGDTVAFTAASLPFTPSFNGHGVGMASIQSNVVAGTIGTGPWGFSGTNQMSWTVMSVNGTVARTLAIGGVVSYFV